MIDLKMIQREGMPGASNELLPETATFGGMKLREEPGGRHFLFDAVVFNPKTATCGVCGYGCLYPQSMNIPGGTYIIALADSGEVIAVNAHMCDGTNQTGWECVSDFSTDDTSIATVDPWCQSRGYGFSGGGTTIRTVARDVPGPYCGEWTLLASRPVQVFTFTVGVSPGEVRPSGTGGTVASTVTVSTSPATPGKSVSLSAAAHNNGGHVGHTGSRPLGSFAPSSGTPDSTGKFSSTYTASIFGGGVDITAKIGSATSPARYLEVRVPDLGVIATTNDWNLVGTTGTHPDNHYGTATTNVGLAAIARDYNDQYYGVGQYPPDGDKVLFNDMGLVNGGKFDLSNSWSATSDHQEHKLGLNCDFYSGNVPTSRWGFLTGRFVVRGSQDYLDETATKNHWHLRFTQ